MDGSEAASRRQLSAGRDAWPAAVRLVLAAQNREQLVADWPLVRPHAAHPLVCLAIDAARWLWATGPSYRAQGPASRAQRACAHECLRRPAQQVAWSWALAQLADPALSWQAGCPLVDTLLALGHRQGGAP